VTVPPDLLEVLVCPACHGDLAERPEDGGGDTGLECFGCGRVYPVLDDIPIMLVDRATPPTRAASDDRGDR
jgi:uncharacterized protein YbaR (Trm112 family)